MLSRRTARHPHATPSRRSRAGRTLPALALGVTALALTVPTALPALAAPGPADGSHLTAEAKEAGLEPGNATMGWRERGTDRPVVSEKGGLLRDSPAVSRSTTKPFTPKGVLGVDVSGYQGKVKWSTWTKKNKDFAYIKATEGTSFKNKYFLNQYRGAKKAGLVRGAYHFANPAGKAGYLQARYFVKNGGRWTADGRTLPGVLDIEYNPYGSTCYGVSKKKMVAWVSSFTREYKKLTGKDAVIYTTTDWWKRCTGNSSKFGKTNPLWIARYGTTKPGALPKGWRTATFWQYTSIPIDQDVFPSKMKRLRVLATEK